MFQLSLSNNFTFQLNDLIIYVLITLPSPGLQEMNSYILILFFFHMQFLFQRYNLDFCCLFTLKQCPHFTKKFLNRAPRALVYTIRFLWYMTHKLKSTELILILKNLEEFNFRAVQFTVHVCKLFFWFHQLLCQVSNH